MINKLTYLIKNGFCYLLLDEEERILSKIYCKDYIHGYKTKKREIKLLDNLIKTVKNKNETLHKRIDACKEIFDRGLRSNK